MYAVLPAAAQLPFSLQAKDLYIATNGSDSFSHAANSQSSLWRKPSELLLQNPFGREVTYRLV
jgi:hypothetical protein